MLQEGDSHRSGRWLEFFAAALLALATVGTAWCGYQAARWGGQQTTHFVEAIGAYSDSLQLGGQATQVEAFHVDLFVAWASALSEDNQQLADFLYQRFPPELKTASEAWLALEPLIDPGAPPSPFDTPEYSLPETVESERKRQLADELFARASTDNQTSDNYVLLTVIFASVLFFGGISGKFRTRVIDLAMLTIATLVFLAGVVILFTYPIY
jgi:hypothetical protein